MDTDQLEKQPRKNDALWIVVGTLILSTIICSVFFLMELDKLNGAYEDLTKIEYLSSSTQRFVRLVNANEMDMRVQFVIDDETNSSFNSNSLTAISVLQESEINETAQRVLASWNQLVAIIDNDTSEVLNEHELFLAADNHFNQMTNLSKAISEYVHTIHIHIAQIQGLITCLLFAIGFIIIHSIVQTRTELKQSQAVAALAKIDTATGLYSRSKCQDLFKVTNYQKGTKTHAVIVMDLNDLKKTNDIHGHRLGDELIYTFAQLLKSASNTHIVPPFIGRYGGDEFVVYYEDVLNEAEVKTFLKELSFSAAEFNSHKATVFQISFAAGYALGDPKDPNCTIRQLFDMADEAMYKNKMKMKSQQKEQANSTGTATNKQTAGDVSEIDKNAISE